MGSGMENLNAIVTMIELKEYGYTEKLEQDFIILPQDDKYNKTSAPIKKKRLTVRICKHQNFD